MNDNVFDILEAGAPAGRVALADEGGRDMTRGELFGRARRIAGALVALGVAPGDRVAAQIDKFPDGVALYLGCLAAGAALLPLNVAYTGAELDHFLRDATPKLFLCRPSSLDAMRALGAAAGVARVESFGDGAGSFLALVEAAREIASVPRGAHDLAAILYTSGTTGRSKGAMITHDNLSSNARALVAAWRFTDSDVLIHALPIFHVHGLFVALNVALLSGARIDFQRKFDADAVVAALPRATCLMGVPTFYVRLLDHPGFTREAAAHMRLFVSGSAPLLAETHREFSARTGHAILERYGMTETGMIASNPYDGARVPGAVGFPLSGIAVRIADSEGRALADGETGVIEVRGPNVFKGYWNMPEKTAAEFRDGGWFVTGDVGTVGPDGHLRIVGRAKDLVISGGFNVYPKEIEEEIDALPGVLESAVIGLPHRDFGEGVTAIVVARPGATLDEAAILAAVAPRLAAFKRPKRALIVADLPRNAMGKVQKAELRRTHAGLYG
ncbi:MAG: malonyl-CoA synthase [Hyphomicrobiales bacterium]|nr:malonyl-CoA synthase [Hyphomicrobiales bacterium]